MANQAIMGYLKPKTFWIVEVAYSTLPSQEVPYLFTDQVQCYLILVIEQESVFSAWFDHRSVNQRKL